MRLFRFILGKGKIAATRGKHTPGRGAGDSLPGSWFDDAKPAQCRGAGEVPTDVAEIAVRLGLSELVHKIPFRFPRQTDQKDLLPDPTGFSTEDAIARIVARPMHEPRGGRRSMENQFLLLQAAFSGRAEILLWHAMAISYLRRDTPHSAKARALFFKIWDEQHEWLAETLNGRWLISALQTFADHARSPEEARCGGIGYVYGSLIKIYECEIASTPSKAVSTLPYISGSVPGLFEFQPGDDILFNLNTFVMAAGIGSGPGGVALSALLAKVKAGQSAFSRADELIGDRADAYLSFTGKRKKV